MVRLKLSQGRSIEFGISLRKFVTFRGKSENFVKQLIIDLSGAGFWIN